MSPRSRVSPLNQGIPALFVVLTFPFFFAGGWASYAQTEQVPTLEELTLRAQWVHQEYPWLDQQMNGLAVNCYGVPREAFLRGMHAATDLVFEGTQELPQSLTLFGLFRNAEEVFQRVCSDDPFLACQADMKSRQVVFSRNKDETAGLSDEELIARYRRTKPTLDLARTGGGLLYPGMLVVNGTPFPSPLSIEITMDRENRAVLIQANGISLREIRYLDPTQVDAELFRATTSSQVGAALATKADQIWSELSRFPLSSTKETLTLMGQRIGYMPGVLRTEVGETSLLLVLRDMSQVKWEIPKGTQQVSFGEQEAYRRAYDFQNQVLSVLARGGAFFISDKFGIGTVPSAFELNPALERLVSDTTLTLREKELEIRKERKGQSGFVLEYFYTSLVGKGQPLAARAAPDTFQEPSAREGAPPLPNWQQTQPQGYPPLPLQPYGQNLPSATGPAMPGPPGVPGFQGGFALPQAGRPPTLPNEVESAVPVPNAPSNAEGAPP